MREAILSKTHCGLKIYAHILQMYYPGSTVLSLRGKDCPPALNPFTGDKPTLLISIVDNVALHRDTADTTFTGDAFTFAALHYKKEGEELYNLLIQELNLEIRKTNDPIQQRHNQPTLQRTPIVASTAISTAQVIENANKLFNEDNVLNDNSTLFTVKPANAWIEEAKKRPAPQMLFSSLWFEGEICILFADTNLGKSILAVQIGDSITTGTPVKGFSFTAMQQSVLYFDFELSDKQFEIRYSQELDNHYSFNQKFLRVEMNPDADLPINTSFEDFLSNSMERAIIETGSKTLIIDNLTYLKNDNEKARDALPLMKHLKDLKRKYGLSILALAHTPKRDFSKPISKNDLQGSKMLMNFCDSCLAIGESFKDKTIRYIKQIKQRNKEEMYGSDNIILCEIAKPVNFLNFSFIGFGNELEHLKVHTEKDRSTNIELAKELSKQGKSQREIASQLGIAVSTVNKYLKKT